MSLNLTHHQGTVRDASTNDIHERRSHQSGSIQDDTHSKSAKNSSQDDKGNKKQPKSKSKWAACGSQDDQQTEVVDLTPDDLDGAFSTLMNKCSQESAKSQQKVSKPASSDVNKSSQDSNKSHGDESL